MSEEEIKRLIAETVQQVVLHALEPKLHDLLGEIEGLNESLLTEVQGMNNILAPRLDVLARRADRFDLNLRSIGQEIAALRESVESFRNEVRITQEELREIRAMLERRTDWGDTFHLN